MNSIDSPNENKSNISLLIADYIFDRDEYNSRWYVHLIFLVIGIFTGFILSIIGWIMFLKRIKTKKKLDQKKVEIVGKLNLIFDELSLEEYLYYLEKIKLRKVISKPLS
jgi:hypothetical protein